MDAPENDTVRPIGRGPPPRLMPLIGHLAAGRTNEEIADLLGLTKHTVEKYVSELKLELGARDRVELVVICRRLIE